VRLTNYAANWADTDRGMLAVPAPVRASATRSRALPPMLQDDARRGRDALRFSIVERSERQIVSVR
jgi:hypothetical protein